MLGDGELSKRASKLASRAGEALMMMEAQG
jgi:hypothetical protein